MDCKAAETGLEGGEQQERDTFLPVNLERLGEEFQGEWRRENQEDWSWSSSQSSVLQPCSDPVAPQSNSLLLPPILSLLEDVKDSEDCEDFSYASETQQEALIIEQKEEARETGEEAELMSSQRETQKAKPPEAEKQVEFNFREGRFHRKPKADQTESLVESSRAEEEGKEEVVERVKEQTEDVPPLAAFSFEESCLPASIEAHPVQQSSQDPSRSQAIVIEWEDFASCQQKAKSSSESRPSPIFAQAEESAQTTAPQLRTVQESPRAAEAVREKLESPVSSQSERDKEALLGTQSSRQSTKIVRFRDVWPAFEQLDISPYLQPEDSAIPAQSIPWWKRCCMGEREEHNIEASRQQRRRIFALHRVKVRDEERNWEVMMSIWKMCMRTKEDCDRQGSHWARLGFACPDPLSTFQTAHLLGLIHLLLFISRYSKSQQFLVKLTIGQFPLARLSCFLTSAAVQSLREGLLESWIYSGFSAYNAVNSYYTGLMVRCVERWEKKWEKQWERLGKEAEIEGRRNPGAILRLAQSKSLLQA